MNRKLLMLNLILRRDGHKRAQLLRKKKFFHSQGENCYFHPYKLPSEGYLVSFGNNVVVAANVTFLTHDIISMMLNNAPNFKRKLNEKRYRYYMGTIEVSDNVFIGANSTIMPNIRINSNVIIASGSVVTKDVPSGTIVGGNPAKVIGTVNKLAQERLKVLDDMPTNKDSIEKINEYFWSNMGKSKSGNAI